MRDDVGDATGDAGGLARTDAELAEIFPTEESNTAIAPFLCCGFLCYCFPCCHTRCSLSHSHINAGRPQAEIKL